MNNVEFLPLDYSKKHAQRQSQPGQIFVSSAIIVLVAGAALAQQYNRHRVEQELAAIAPVYDAAVQQQNRLAEAQKQLAADEAAAELYTYLGHPWPRTQLLAALLDKIPDSITLQQIQILRETPARPEPKKDQPLPDPKAEAEKLKTYTPAKRDFLKLSDRIDAMQTVVVLTGATSDPSALHRYIGDLHQTDIFDSAELDCFNHIESGKKDDGAILFRAVLAVTPGYGQAGGPSAPKEHPKNTSL